ncbi:MAG: deoxynucleoside kinase [bacterium]
MSTLHSGTIIAIEGAIGAGKTPLAKILAQEFGGESILQEPSQNPFLPKFYEDPQRWGLITQVTFLLLRYQVLNELHYRSLFSKAIVLDFLFEKDRIFAALTLSERDYSVYLGLAQSIRKNSVLPTPDLVIYLKASPEKLWQSIQIRNRSEEEGLSPEFINELCDAYNRLFQHWEQSPLIVVNTHTVDFVNHREDRKLIVDAVLNTRGGVKYIGFGETND